VTPVKKSARKQGLATASAGPPPVDILLVEDSPGDVRLTREALKDGGVTNRLVVASDGEEALAYLRREGAHAHDAEPGLILLDLNLPRLDGRELLRILKSDPDLKRIPVVVLTTSTADVDVLNVYDLGGNCYIEKPVSFDSFTEVVRSIAGFWLSVARIPVQADL
jgi:two-component system, chemotaxis family, response regulator Rcp1